tara:strand:- start:738 stop:1001 length:264 start_codon:yes stop_codon:yes gene_type:complete
MKNETHPTEGNTTKMNDIALTPGSAHLLQGLRDIEQSYGQLILRDGHLNVSQRDHLSDLKKKGLVELVGEEQDADGTLQILTTVIHH